MEIADITHAIADLDDDILVKKTEIMVQNDPTARAKLTKELNVLHLRKEIEEIKKKIKQLS